MKVGSSGLYFEPRAMRDRSPHCGTGVLARRFAFAGLKFLEVCDGAQSKATREDARFTFVFWPYCKRAAGLITRVPRHEKPGTGRSTAPLDQKTCCSLRERRRDRSCLSRTVTIIVTSSARELGLG
jgi:hypothetical protein